MSEFQIRSYVMASAFGYLKKAAIDERGRKAIDGLSQETRAFAENPNRALWCPVPYCAEVYQAIASLSDGDDDRARTALIECGKASAFEASNTFLRLVMKVLTPKLLAKKLPDVWRSDCNCGNVAAEVSDDGIRNTYSDIGAFSYVAPAAVGFVAFALQTMGKEITSIQLDGWSLATPAPDTFSFSILWKT